ncbi:MAG: His/Gly/Thr/Pro-type tRNA ligase C-terminal domain-containing protein [Patescibacteria group bacterium]
MSPQTGNIASQPKKSVIHPQHQTAQATAGHYGFVPFNNLVVEKTDIAKARAFKENKGREAEKSDTLSFEGFLEEKIAIMRNHIEKKMIDLPQPAMISYSGPLEGNPHTKKGNRDHLFNIDIIGNPKSIADAITIETAYVITKEHYPDLDLEIQINSIGDKDSLARFTREFIIYYKKNLNELSAPCRILFKKDPFELLNCGHEKCVLIHNESPKAIAYLTEPSRVHFREVLEYLESLSLPYTINHALVGSRNYCSGIIFRITGIPKKNKDTIPTVLALGERYNTVSRKAWGKKEIPAIGAALLINSTGKATPKRKKEQDARFYFIQLGYDAKLKSLSLIEMLRQAKIPVIQSLSRDKITSQLAAAEKLNVPYILLVGQKEAIENSVTVRHMNNRSQETIPVPELIEYLRQLP